MTSLANLLTGTLLTFVGLCALALSLARRRRPDRLLASFGAFASLYGARLLVGGEAIGYFGGSETQARWAGAWITLWIGVPAWAFFGELFASRWHRPFRIGLVLACGLSAAGMAADLAVGRPGLLTGMPNNLLVLLLLVTAGLATIVELRRVRTLEFGVTAGGLLVLFLFALMENLSALGWMPWPRGIEAVGFVLFSLSLGFVAARRFVTAGRQLAEIEGELGAARRIQRSLLPKILPSSRGVTIASRFEPTSEVAGDFWDVVETANGGLGIVVADVAGHGVPAALVAAMIKSAVLSHRERMDRPAELLGALHGTLRGTLERSFVTAVCAHLDPRTGVLRVACGGHPAALVARAGADVAEEVGGLGPVIGRLHGATWTEETRTLEPGDRVVFFTDGLVEARRTDGEPFGDERLRVEVARHRDLEPESMAGALLAALRSWLGAGPNEALDDDLTLVVVGFDSPPATPSPGQAA